MKRHVLAATLLLASLGGGIWGSAPSAPPSVAAAPAASSAPAATASQPAATETLPWQAIIRQLASDDFAQREAAQKELGRFTWRQLDFLRLAADAASDPEVKSRLAARVAAIEEDIAVNPPGLTVDLKNASLLDVADALGKGMGTKLDIWPPNGNGQNFVYTLQAKEKPFWEVFMALSRQHGLSLQDIGDNQMRLMAQSGQEWHNGVIVGPVAIFPQNITRQRTVNLQAEKGQELSPESMNLYCQVVIDPRVRIVKYSNPVFTSIVDDAGNTLFQQAVPPDQPGGMWDVNGRVSVQGLSAGLQMPEKKGTRIVSAKGTIRFAVQTAQEQVEINDLEKKSGQSFDVAGVTIQLSRFNVQGDVNNSTINLTLNENANAAFAGGIRVVGGLRVNGMNNSPPPATVTILDSTDRVVFNYTLRGGGMGTSMGGSGYTGPFKMRISVATKSKDVSFPFELKDLPLP